MEGGNMKFRSERDIDVLENEVAVISNLEELRVLWPDIFKKGL